jgi:predicted transcriptional regulator
MTVKNKNSSVHALEKTKQMQSSVKEQMSEEYTAHQVWLEKEIERGIFSANNNELVPNAIVARWVHSLA